MSQIRQDLEGPRRASKRRPLVLVSALTATVAAAGLAAAVVIGTGGTERPRATSSATPAGASLSGRQVLLAAATTAARLPEGSGKYWYVKTVYVERSGKPFQTENWTQRDGQTWFRGEKSKGTVVKLGGRYPFRLGGPEVSFDQLQKLPTEPEALQAWIANALDHSDVRTSAGKPDAAMKKLFVFDGLVSLVSQLPAPPKVRAAAFRAIASYPDVKSLGAFNGGQGLQIPVPSGGPRRLVVDPATALIHDTDFFVTADGAEVLVDGTATVAAGWTNQLPK